MDILVTYDVETQDKSGQRRLRRVATICQNFGQRVQKSVFECRVTQQQLEEMMHQLTQVVDKERDSLRIYLLHGNRDNVVWVYGRDDYVDFEEPLIF